MSNNDPQKHGGREGEINYEEQMILQNHSNGRSRVGLTPTDGQHDNAYKRTSARSSRRSRPERASYLVATGHLDIEETKQLNERQQHEIIAGLKQNSNDSSLALTATPTTPYRQPSNFTGDDLYVDYVSANNLDTKSNIFSSSAKNKSRGSSRGASSNRGKFKQTSYTEVTLPMKTSPAFEYILKDNKRRNKRCCLWLLYSTLVTVCIAIIVFCSVHLVLRHLNY